MSEKMDGWTEISTLKASTDAYIHENRNTSNVGWTTSASQPSMDQLNNVTDLANPSDNISIGMSIYTFMSLIIEPFVMFMGSVGNLISLVILFRPSMRKVSVNIFLIALAVSDIFYVWWRCHNWFWTTFGIAFFKHMPCMLVHGGNTNNCP